jgi:hypothetical protein
MLHSSVFFPTCQVCFLFFYFFFKKLKQNQDAARHIPHFPQNFPSFLFPPFPVPTTVPLPHRLIALHQMANIVPIRPPISTHSLHRSNPFLKSPPSLSPTRPSAA